MVAATEGVAAEKVWVATPTTAAGVTAVVKAEEARLGLVVARDAANGATLDETTGMVAAAVGKDTVNGGTGREAVHLGIVLPPLSARPRLRAHTTAR